MNRFRWRESSREEISHSIKETLLIEDMFYIGVRACDWLILTYQQALGCYKRHQARAKSFNNAVYSSKRTLAKGIFLFKMSKSLWTCLSVSSVHRKQGQATKLMRSWIVWSRSLISIRIYIFNLNWHLQTQPAKMGLTIGDIWHKGSKLVWCREWIFDWCDRTYPVAAADWVE